ncbi:MAG TPA: DUF2842 domain-containing protein [Sphingomonas sp.]|jgi:hypothetical protein|uniref:DUF2842 domain-containing protein n=1 Tax=Sphingomonas sp. TaxID=28214 RepID=UPI002EDB72F0
MTPTWRKPAGAFAIIGIIVIWAAIVASLSPIVGGWHWIVQTIFYLIAGIVWILPLKPLLLWMETGRWR